MTGSASPAEVVLLLLFVGGCGGFLSGLLGVGGGILFVPALLFAMTFAGLPQDHAMHLAVGTSMAVVFATGATSALGHFRRGAVDLKLVKAWGLFIVAGVVAGGWLAAAAGGAALKGLFATVTLLISFYMAFGREKPETAKNRFLTPPVQRGLCGFIGMLSSMIGVGGAILTVPMMSYSGVPIQRAVGTGAALGTLVSLPGTFSYILHGMSAAGPPLPPWSLGYVNVLAAALIIPTAMLLAPFGVAVSHRLPRPALRRAFAVVLVAVSLRMFGALLGAQP